MRIVLADDAELLRSALVTLLTHHGCTVVGEAATAAEAIRLTLAERPDLALLDVRMPPGRSNEGILAAHRIRAEAPDVAILLLSQEVILDGLPELLATGTRVGYLLKETVGGITGLLDAMRRLEAGGVVIDPLVLEQLGAIGRARHDLATLTEREGEVLELMAEGWSNRTIAARLQLSERTIESHVRSIFLRLDVPSEDQTNRRVAAVLTHLAGRPGRRNS